MSLTKGPNWKKLMRLHIKQRYSQQDGVVWEEDKEQGKRTSTKLATVFLFLILLLLLLPSSSI